MANCPVCQNPVARLEGVRNKDAPATWRVSCPTCALPFEISGKDLNLAAGNQREADVRRRRWVQLLRESAQRGDSIVRLY